MISGAKQIVTITESQVNGNMTIDKAIENERKIVEKCKTEYELECARYGKRTVESSGKLECIKVAEKHEQRAEWLEELKMYRESSYGELYSMVYNKAIDDAKSVILQTLDNEILVDTLHLRLEQLKAKNNERKGVREK